MEGHNFFFTKVDYLGCQFVLVYRIRSPNQTGRLYCKSKPKVGGWIKDPIGYRVRHRRVNVAIQKAQTEMSFWALKLLSTPGL